MAYSCRHGRPSFLVAVSIMGGLFGQVAFAQIGQPGQSDAAALLADDGGPERVVGSWSYSSSLVLDHFFEPVVALLNVSRYAIGDNSDWVPVDQQVLGRLAGDRATPPVAYVVDLPLRPPGDSVDLDHDGATDPGVQIFALAVASNLTGDSHLFQVGQISYRSYLTDPTTSAIRQGTFLVHSPDAAQGFPGGAGDDGLFFTADDPIMTIPAGYTRVTLGHDGSVSFDRSTEVRLDMLEPVANETPDFSTRGILESYDSLIDLLAVRYAYTELHQLDWTAIRAQ